MKRVALVLFVACLFTVACGKSDADSGTPVDPSTLKPATEGVPGVVVVPVSGANHVNGTVDYPTSPPAGGNHNPVWQNCGFYTVPVTNGTGGALARARCGVDHLRALCRPERQGRPRA